MASFNPLFIGSGFLTYRITYIELYFKEFQSPIHRVWVSNEIRRALAGAFHLAFQSPIHRVWVSNQLH